MIHVKAKPGVLVPMEHNPKKYITEHKAVKVEPTVYYVRRMRQGDLIKVSEAASLVPAQREV